MTSPVNYNDILSAYSGYAAAIRPYLLYADTQDAIRRTLTKKTRLAFLDLVARINIADPKKPIMVRVDHTAQKLGISEKSVSRTIAMMVDREWLLPCPDHDGRNNSGKFAHREYLVGAALRATLRMPDRAPDPKTPSDSSRNPETSAFGRPAIAGSEPPASQPPAHTDGLAAAAELTGSPAPEPDIHRTKHTAGNAPTAGQMSSTPPNSGNPASVRPEMSAGLIYAVNNPSLLKEASFKSSLSEKNVQPSKTPKLPADLEALHLELGIDRRGICSLMGLAKTKGHRLQDVWKVKRNQILSSGAREGRAVKYLRFLLNSGEDFAYRARTMLPGFTPGAENPGGQPGSVSGPAASQANSMSAKPGQPETQPGRPSPELAAIAKASQFKKFRHVTNGMVVRMFDHVAEVSQGLQTSIYAGWEMMEKLYIGIARGRLVEVVE